MYGFPDKLFQNAIANFQSIGQYLFVRIPVETEVYVLKKDTI